MFILRNSGKVMLKYHFQPFHKSTFVNFIKDMKKCLPEYNFPKWWEYWLCYKQLWTAAWSNISRWREGKCLAPTKNLWINVFCMAFPCWKTVNKNWERSGVSKVPVSFLWVRLPFTGNINWGNKRLGNLNFCSSFFNFLCAGKPHKNLSSQYQSRLGIDESK